MDTEERFAMIEEGMRKLMHEINQLGRKNQIDRPQNPNLRNHEDRTMKIDIPDFNGYTHDPEHYLDWENRMDNTLNSRKNHQTNTLNWPK